MTSSWITRPGPAITPIQALSRVASAREIACLVGERSAALVWYHDSTPLPSETGLTPERFLRGLGSMGDAIARMRQVPLPPPDASWGRTWGAVPAESVFIQIDYEFPAQMPRVVFAPHVVRWDADGRCTLHGFDVESHLNCQDFLSTAHPKWKTALRWRLC